MSIEDTARHVVDIRELSRHQGHRKVFEIYKTLPLHEALIIVSDQALQDLRSELDRELAGAFRWEALPPVEHDHRAGITKLASTPLPRVVADTGALFENIEPDAQGFIWRLEPGARDLDSNIIALPPEGEIAQHIGPDLDVLILVLDGSGELHTELTTISLHPGALLWLPRNAERAVVAGPEGLRYLTVHQRKPTLNISTRPDR